MIMIMTMIMIIMFHGHYGNCLGTYEVTLKEMDKIGKYQTTTIEPNTTHCAYSLGRSVTQEVRFPNKGPIMPKVFSSDNDKKSQWDCIKRVSYPSESSYHHAEMCRMWHSYNRYDNIFKFFKGIYGFKGYCYYHMSTGFKMQPNNAVLQT